MNDPTPNLQRSDARPTPEAWALRAEWRSEPPSLAREEADRALAALDRAAGETAGAPEGEPAPPVPEDLRSRWAETYGRPVPDEVSDRRVGPASEAVRQWSFSSWLAGVLEPRRILWIGGAAAAAILVMILAPPGGTPTVAPNLAPSHAIRGSGGGVAGDPSPIVVIAPAGAEEVNAATLQALRDAYPKRTLHVVSQADEAAAHAQRGPTVVVVNLASGMVTAWSGGELAGEFPAAVATAPVGARVVSQIESADETLAQPVAVP
jgi:hypothetical protein